MLLAALVLCTDASDLQWLPPQLVDTDSIETWENHYFLRKELTGCYSRMNELSVNFDSGQMCIDLDPLGAAECDVLPEGVYFDVELSNNNGVTIRIKNEQFSYRTVKYICSACPTRTVTTNGVTSQQPYCEILQGTDAARVTLRTLTLFVEVTIGKISIGHTTLNSCYDSSQAKIYLAKSSAQIVLKRAGHCDNVRQNCVNPYYRIDLDFEMEDGSVEQRVIYKVAGNITYQLVEDDLTFEMVGNFTDLLDKSVEQVYIRLYLDCNVTVVFLTSSYAVLSKELAQPFIDPELRIYLDNIVILATSIPQAPEYDALYYDRMKCVDGAIQFYDMRDMKILETFKLKSEKFSFYNVAMRYFQCKASEDLEKCKQKITTLLGTNTADMRVQSSYWFYENADCTGLITYATAYITNIKDTCWSGAEVIYKSEQVCVNPKVNAKFSFCDFKTPTDARFELTIGSDVYKVDTTYSIDVEEICYTCDSKDCTSKLTDAWRKSTPIAIYIINKVTSISDQIPLIAAYNQDYSYLFSKIVIFVIAAASSLVAVIVLEVLIDLRVFKAKERRKDVKIDEINDL